MVSLQALGSGNDTEVPALHWTLPTTLEGIRQESMRLKTTGKPASVSIMCQRQYHYRMCLQEEAVDVGKSERYWTMKRDLTFASVPYLTLGIALRAIKRDVRKVNTDINSGFHNKVDDYLQYSPLVFTYGLKATGYEGRSQWGRLLVSNAFSAAIMATLVNSMKYIIRDMRPDDSKANSFPSGHTATAFMAATILHKEYGLTRSLWYSVGGYTIATGIGVFRVMNDRHWISDVLTGAGIGIFSTELGYALSDLVFKDKYTLRREMDELNDIYEHPSFFSLQAGVGIMPGSMRIPSELGCPVNISHRLSTVIAAEAAYFLNPYLGFGLRARINSTAVTPRWRAGSNHPEAYTDQLSGFDIMGGIYGGLPLNRRMSLGTKLLFGRRHLGDIAISYNEQDNEKKIEGGNSFIIGTGFSFSYALKHNIVWRTSLDYDFTRTRHSYDSQQFRLAIHQLTPGLAICYGF